MEVFWSDWAGSRLTLHMPAKQLLKLHQDEIFAKHPEIAALDKTPQHFEHHPEGNAWQHTLWVVQAMEDIIIRDNADAMILMFAALTHDFGKPLVTEFNIEKGQWTSYGHDKAGVAPATSFLMRIGAPDWVIIPVTALVLTHMRHIGFYTPEITKRSVNRLARHLKGATWQQWLYVIEADYSGRPPKPAHLPESASQIAAMAKEWGIEPE